MNTDARPQATTLRTALFQVAGRLAPAWAGCVLLFCALQANAATVLTEHVISLATQTQNNVPVTFGQVFKQGDVPRGATLKASLDGQPVTLQVDAKATNPDGSLRHAVLTAMVPWLSAHAKLPLTLATGSASTAPSLSLGQLLSTNYDAVASFKIGGKTYTVNARALLQAADNVHACARWDAQCNLWLSGPLVSAWVVNGPATASDGTSSSHLRVYFAVRAYAGATPGTIGYVRTDVIVENTDAFAAQGQPQYTATLTSGSASYTSPALTQYTATRWHKVLWWNNAEPKVYLQQDTQYIQASQAVSRYMPLKPDEGFLASVRQSCAPLDHCDQTKAMGNTGAQPAIGPLPRWTSVYIIDPDVRAYNWMLANTDALGGYSIHYRDHATGWPVSIEKHPYVTMANWGWANGVAQQNNAKGAKYKADLLPNCVDNSVVSSCHSSSYKTGNPNDWDNAHQPAESYVPYMVTGDYYYMSELAFGASHNNIWSNEGYRGYSKGLIDHPHSQVRGKAWVLRNMANAAWLLPDSHPLKNEFIANVENSLADWNSKYINNPHANPLGVMESGVVYSVHGGHSNAVAPWQHSFLTWSVGHAAELGFAGAAAFRNWLAKFEIGLMTDWQTNPTQGYCWLEASGSKIQVKDSAGNWLPSYTAVYGATFPTLAGLACNSPAMVEAMGKLEGEHWQAGEMHAYPYSATGYPSNLQIGLATAANIGLPNAQEAWAIFDSRSVKPSGDKAYNNYPNFALLPRSTAASEPVPPSKSPAATPPPSGITRNIMLPVEQTDSTQGTAQPAVQASRAIVSPAARKLDVVPAESQKSSPSRASRVLVSIVRTLRTELPNFLVSRIWRPTSSDPAAYSAPNAPQSEDPVHTGASVVQQTQQHSSTVAGRAAPSIQREAEIHPSTETAAPMLFRSPSCQLDSAGRTAPAACVRKRPTAAPCKGRPGEEAAAGRQHIEACARKALSISSAQTGNRVH